MAHLTRPSARLSSSLLSLPTTLRTTTYLTTQSRSQSTTNPRKHPKTALFFPGQGVQRVGMLTDWLAAFPRTLKPFLEEIDATLNLPLTRIIADGPNSKLTATENAQPAIMATSIAILRVLEQEFGFKTNERIDVCLGHSLGEFAALVAAGYLRQADALVMVRKRAEVMARCSREAGEEVGMIALVCEADHLAAMTESIREFLGLASEGSKMDSHGDTDLPPVQQVLIANVNAKNQIVLSGSIRRINELLTHLRQFAGHDPRAVRLKSDSPFHSPLMKPAADMMKRLLAAPSGTAGGEEDVVMWPGQMPCISNVSARAFTGKQQLKDLLAVQCVETVLWHDSIVHLHREEKVRRWVGIGPGRVGRNLVGKEVGMKGAVKGGGVWGISDPGEVERVLKDLDMTDRAAAEEED